jgi:UDP-N-acetylmuramoyl-L-alanyl-D-glutamate--2,6-diaminopimelate ligase
VSDGAVERPLGDLIGVLEVGGWLRSVLVPGSRPAATVGITSVVLDSRAVRHGSLFAALPGQRTDGADYAADAVAAGAAAVLTERALAGISVPQVLVRGARPALALAAAWFNGFPSERLGVVGITGTDGKTTTGYLVRSMLQACGFPTGLVGTVDVVAGGESLGNPARATTPEAPDLQAHLARMVTTGDRFAVVESTSHGLAQDRCAAVAYDVGVLTNLTQEHLEFHGTHEAYRAAKRRLFEWLATGERNPEKGWGKHAVLNADDPVWADFGAAARGAGAEVISYGAAEAAQVRPLAVHQDASGLRITVVTPRWTDEVRLGLAGRFNVHNALAAICVGEVLGLDPAAMREGLSAVRRVPGRMEPVTAGQPFQVIVDYAHTAESLRTVLDGLAPLAAAGGGGLIVVFGSAGDRDRMKRPMMGRVAGERARLVVVTDEDPRTEDREAILEEIAAGAEAAGRRRGHDLLLVPDRRAAIAQAIGMARPGDVVLLAGKGHEKTIEMADGDLPWDEAAVARAALAELGHASHGA